MVEEEKIVQIKNLVKYYPVEGKGFFRKVSSWLHAVDNISFDIYKGETLGLVGESGCGKTTVGKLLLKLLTPTSGEVYIDSVNIFDQMQCDEKKFRNNVQMIFQDAFSSFDKRKNVENIIKEPLLINNKAKRSDVKEKVAYYLSLVGLKPEVAGQFPHELSSGQKQSVGIARSLCLNPKFVVADEPISNVDVSVRAQILNLLKDLQERLSLTYLFISHDIRVVHYLANRIAVMYVGKIVEIAEGDELFINRYHPYTEALLSAVPVEDPYKRRDRQIIKGEVPSPVDPAPGCRFSPRCPYAIDKCKNEDPELIEKTPNHFVACFVDFIGTENLD
ncbi:MAG: putative ABC transporter ATP-binding protein [candidate division TA06 bacterium 34_109]|uniref:Putative ABC transporter ATP-binding protein n=1 Tax=candidate division TA06 bacterium 34_109 TaxID=1635277 RepID=A0A101HZ25_UNCT6|nr:MAG: putative ABC transporter ATP-binding protein [candidate division TA06 bacterium 34_109]